MIPSASILRRAHLPRWLLPVTCVSIYALFFFLLDDHLPEWIFRDTSKIELIAEGGIVTSSRSFGGTANFFHVFPPQFRDLFIFLIGSAVIAFMVSRTTMLGAVLGLMLVAPAVMLCLFGPSKEILVFCMSGFIVIIARFRSTIGDKDNFSYRALLALWTYR
jgi:hypothetical protein